MPCPSLDSRGEAGGGQQVLSTQPDQLSHQMSDSEVELVSHIWPIMGLVPLPYTTPASRPAQATKWQIPWGQEHLGLINLCSSENKLCTDLRAERVSWSNMNYTDALPSGIFWLDRTSIPDGRNGPVPYLLLPSTHPAWCRKCGCSMWLLLCLLCIAHGSVWSRRDLSAPPPFYAGFPYISHLYAKVELIHVHQDSEITEVNTHLFQLTVGQLVKTLLEAKLKGEKSKGLVLINPQNPLGGIYSWDSLKEYLEFAKRYALHEIIGEIYCVWWVCHISQCSDHGKFLWPQQNLYNLGH